MTTCARDAGHVYPPHNKTCPWCAIAATPPAVTRPPASQQIALPPPARAVPAQRVTPQRATGPTSLPAGIRRRSRRSEFRIERVLVAVGLALAAVGVYLYFRVARDASIYPYGWLPYWFYWALVAAAASILTAVQVWRRGRSASTRMSLAGWPRDRIGVVIALLPVSYVVGRLYSSVSGRFPAVDGVRLGGGEWLDGLASDLFIGAVPVFLMAGAAYAITCLWRSRFRRLPIWGLFLVSAGLISILPSQAASEEHFAAMMDAHNCGWVSRFASPDGSAMSVALFPASAGEGDAGEPTNGLADRLVIWSGTDVIVNRTLPDAVPCSYLFRFDPTIGKSESFGDFIAGSAWSENSSEEMDAPDPAGFVLAVSLDRELARVWNYDPQTYDAGIVVGSVVVSRFEADGEYRNSELRAFAPEDGKLAWKTKCPDGGAFNYIKFYPWENWADDEPLVISCQPDPDNYGDNELWKVDPGDGSLTYLGKA